MTISGSAVSPTIDVLVSKCQVLAGRFLDAPPSDLLDGIARVAADVPLDELTVPERMMAAMILVRVLSRWVERSQLVSPAPITERLVDLGTLPVSVGAWRGRWTHLIDLCGHALSVSGEWPATGSLRHPRARALLDIIRTRFHEPTLHLGGVAAAANISPWYATRVLAQETGKSFVVHLRQCRVTAARRLLEETSLSVKEIAARTGYSSARQLTRDLKRLYATTPRAFRLRRPD
jgi:AraC-like DNA-binding protein